MLERLRWLALRANSASLHWFRRRFTPAGRLACVAVVGSALWGFDTSQSMTYQAFGLSFACVAVALLLSLRRPRDLSARRVLPRFATAGEPMPYRIEVVNAQGRARRGFFIGEAGEDPRPAFADFHAEPEGQGGRGAPWFVRWSGYARWSALVARRRAAGAAALPVPELPPRGRAELEASLTPPRRGRLRLPALEASRPDPLGLAWARAPVGPEQSVIVLPKRYPVPRLSLPGSRRCQPGGVAMASSVGDSQEFMSLRDYRAGDSPRLIHWRSWAKAGKPVVKECEDEYFTRHALVLDTFARPGQEEAFEEAVSVAASFACSVLTQESLLDLLFVGARSYCFTAGRGLGGTDRLLEVLAGAQPCRESSFDRLHGAVLSRAAALSGAVCVLLGFDEPRRRLVRSLRGSRLPVRAFVVAEEPLDPAPEPGVHRLEPGRIAEGLAQVRP